jgi:hypothetical protein
MFVLVVTIFVMAPIGLTYLLGLTGVFSSQALADDNK